MSNLGLRAHGGSMASTMLRGGTAVPRKQRGGSSSVGDDRGIPLVNLLSCGSGFSPVDGAAPPRHRGGAGCAGAGSISAADHGGAEARHYIWCHQPHIHWSGSQTPLL